MKLMLDDAGHAVVRDGNPVYTDSTGRQITVDVAALSARADKAEHAAAVSEAFHTSKFAAAKSKLPPAMLRDAFGEAFRLEGGKLVGYSGSDKLYSRERPGEVADFDEALAMMVDRYKHKAVILGGADTTTRQTTAPSAQQSKGTNSVPRAVFERMNPRQRMDHCLTGGTIHD